VAGPGTRRFKAGDAVMALVNGGGYATHTIAEEGACLPVPKSLDMTHAGGMPETFFTVWHNVFERGRLQRGDWILIHGGSSGIGVAAIQLAKAFGAKVIVTAGSADKCAACMALGADHAIDYNTTDFVEAVKEVGLKLPLVVRLEGNNVAAGKATLAASNLHVISGDDILDAAQKIVAAVGPTRVAA